jgi:hypothetical protein
MMDKQTEKAGARTAQAFNSKKPMMKSGSDLLADLTLQQASANRKIALVSLGQECIKATAMFDRAQRMGGNAKTETLAERVGDQRDIAQVRQELALGLVVRMADIVPGQDGFAGQFATTGHGITYSLYDWTTERPTRKSGLQAAGLFWKLRFHKEAGWACQDKPWISGKFSNLRGCCGLRRKTTLHP